MQLKDLVKPLTEMTVDELHEHLRKMRHNREHARPVARKKAERAEKKASVTRMSKLDKMLAGLSEADRAELMKQLETDNG